MSYGDLGWRDHAVFAHEAEQETKKWKDDYWAATQKLSDANIALAYAHKALEDQGASLAQQAEDLLAYKDYYGTSVAQVKHLQGCEVEKRALADFLGRKVDEFCNGDYYCPNYPTE